MIQINLEWSEIYPLHLFGVTEVNGAPTEVKVFRSGAPDGKRHRGDLELHVIPAASADSNLGESPVVVFPLPQTLTPITNQDVVVNGVACSVRSHPRTVIEDTGIHRILHAGFNPDATDALFVAAGMKSWEDLHAPPLKKS